VISERPQLRGVGHEGGSRWSPDPADDAILMKWILHDWSDAHCATLLKKQQHTPTLAKLSRRSALAPS